MTQKNLTPRQITEHLDRYIVGQNEAKRAVAIALRNRYRRSLLNEDMKAEVIPKNILMIGPTGVGKTEIARRIAKLTNAPFVKVEATKFTEVGYVGRDVESMVRDLVEASHRLVKEEMMESVKEQAEQLANEAIVKLLVPSLRKKQSMQNPFEMLFGGKEQTSTDDTSSDETEVRSKRAQIAIDLRNGKLENEWVTVEVTEQTPSIFDALQGTGMDMSANNGMQDMLSSLMPKKQKKRRVQVKDARRILTIEEANKLIDADEVAQESIVRAEQTGIIFIDEIDKIASKEGNSSANVSREGVQRDILPIVEGSTVTTKYGAVKTDYMLFIAAGAFHMSKPSDLIPELQGRFPIRVELEKLTKQDFVRILQEPDQSLILQYKALLETEGVEINFTSDAIERIAEIATEVNQETDNIGARRLHTILERLLEELSFEAAEIAPASIPINAAYVDQKLAGIVKNKDLSQFIL
ncbi:ATP-dependent protease ATPase subunit HslU [Lysinibacillus sp. fkY74-1]|uniref:ATP-dependent protease ATPase subunit HslU n=3 Tax=Lysinibacillus TaxID=400634 RepID=B1HQJ6_LYSSC|nr:MULTISPECIES: ATP-dependent protease ATPase subunit HslU [Lysinibacillus]MBE5085129.1 ATP-dependent protease ATPase subunit HslU [Bacillus thuringiensis]ACA39143.1 ATP-dependent hsl protease ATP-binding subunit [Lysinibacillus sphaericus C3-41]AMO34642.1 Clp protease [Lysinibacillus sphaericus]AMR90243.1 HslU--HslV peptidase ATPase subunit [Lysinibacillus sphaericus]ANA44293.1 HslU--HslV peptidase ATPase subunit [Lysinibacillus sphaericus]